MLKKRALHTNQHHSHIQTHTHKHTMIQITLDKYEMLIEIKRSIMLTHLYI